MDCGFIYKDGLFVRVDEAVVQVDEASGHGLLRFVEVGLEEEEEEDGYGRCYHCGGHE